MSLIEGIRARQILDSRGNPTVEVEVLTAEGHLGRACVPSGASTGEHEACELRDGDKSIYLGKSVLKAVDNMDQFIAPRLEGEMDVTDQVAIDRLLIELDGTENKSKLGANAILAVSMACARAAAQESGMPLYRYLGGAYACTLPVPLMNVINGGAHADNNLDFQEFMLVPHGFSCFSDALRAGVEVFHHLKKVLAEKKLNTAVGDEGGFAPSLSSNEEALELLCAAIQKAGYKVGTQTSFALDVAASSFFKEGKYCLDAEGSKKTSEEMVSIYENLCEKYPIVSIEDGLDENDWAGWELLTKRLGKKVQLVGDDLFVTNSKLLAKGIEKGVANSILIKLNQIGTVTETLKTIELAKVHGYTTIISHRSGEQKTPSLPTWPLQRMQDKSKQAAHLVRIGLQSTMNCRIEEDLEQQALFHFRLGKNG